MFQYIRNLFYSQKIMSDYNAKFQYNSIFEQKFRSSTTNFDFDQNFNVSD